MKARPRAICTNPEITDRLHLQLNFTFGWNPKISGLCSTDIKILHAQPLMQNGGRKSYFLSGGREAVQTYDGEESRGG